jgi:hypothetical protein
VLLSGAGGAHPLWRRDGQELFYMSPADDIVGLDVGALLRADNRANHGHSSGRS